MTHDQQAQPTVLVVDDEEDLRDIMRRMLERKGFTTLTAGDADAAMVACRDYAGEIDLLVTDLGMPGSSGKDVAETASLLRPSIRIIFVSGLPKELAVDRGLVSAEAQMLQKPFTTGALVDAVTAALAGTAS